MTDQEFVYLLLICFPHYFINIEPWIWDSRRDVLKRMPIIERIQALQRPAFDELIPYLDDPAEIIKRTPEINEEIGVRIRKRKQIDINGWGIETAIKIDFYFKEAVGECYDITDDEMIENAYIDAVSLHGDKSYQVTIHDFDFNEKKWDIKTILHYVYMGYLDGSRMSLYQILWTEKNITWDIWQQTKRKIIQPEDCTSITLMGERWGQAREAYDFRRPKEEKIYCRTTGIMPYDFNNYIPSKKERQVMVKNIYFDSENRSTLSLI